MIALGVISVLDLDEVGTDPLVKELGIDAAMAEKIVAAAVEDAKLLASESRHKQAESFLQKQTPMPDNKD